MTFHPLVLLVAYSLVIVFVSILGGKLSEFGTVSHTRIQAVMSLVAGFIIGIAIFHLIPHSLELIPGDHAVEVATLWIVFGILTMVLLLKVFHFHHHDFTEESAHDHLHSSPLQSADSKRFLIVFIGLVFHSITEGIALGTSIRIGFISHGVLPGLGVSLAIILHKPLDAYSIMSLLQRRPRDTRIRLIVNCGFALVCPVVAFASYMLTAQLGEVGEVQAIGYVLAFAAGAFLCISLSDLLPEIQFHSHDRFLLLVALVVGVALAYGLFYIEESMVHAAVGEAHH